MNQRLRSSASLLPAASLFVAVCFSPLPLARGAENSGGARVPAARRISPGSFLCGSGQAQAPPVLVQEKGKFRILVGGQEVGKEDFEIAPSREEWVARGTAEVEAPKGTITHITAALKVKPDGTPVHYEWSVQGPKKASATVEFQGLTVTAQLRLEGMKPFTQQFFFNSPHIAILDNNLYHQYAILARLYDWNKRGVQSFPVLIPQELTPGSITLESAAPPDAPDTKPEMLRVKSQDLEIDLYLDRSHRLLRIAVPSSNAEAIRE